MPNEHNALTPMQRFWRLLKPDSKEVRNIYVYSIFNGLISLSLPLGFQAIVNLIQGGQVSTSWIVLVFLLVLGVIAMGVLRIQQLRITENLQQKIFTRAAFELSYRILHIRTDVLYKHYAPELMNRFFDIVAVQKGLPKMLIDFSASIFIVIFSLLLLSFYHPFFILFSIALVLLIYIIFQYIFRRGLSTSLEESKFKYKVAHWLEELSRTYLPFKLVGKSYLPYERTDVEVSSYLKARENHFKVLVLQYYLLILFKVFVATGLLAIGGILVINQQMNIGQFIAAEIIVLTVISSIEKLITSLDSIYDILTSLEKVGQLTDLQLERRDGEVLKIDDNKPGMEVVLDRVSFAYPQAIKKTLREVSLRINAGESAVITGPSGSGKSTLLCLISGLFPISEGTILYEQLPIGNISLESLRLNIGNYLAMEHLFEGTLLENITLGRSRATLENVQWAIKQLEMEAFIKQLPKGYNTLIQPQGKGLPESIISKIILARSIVTRPKLLLLENPFEFLDTNSTKRIMKFLLKKENKWTLIVVSPYLPFLKEVDKIIVLKEGTVYKVGNYEQFKGGNILKF